MAKHRRHGKKRKTTRRRKGSADGKTVLASVKKAQKALAVVANKVRASC